MQTPSVSSWSSLTSLIELKSVAIVLVHILLLSQMFCVRNSLYKQKFINSIIHVLTYNTFPNDYT